MPARNPDHLWILTPLGTLGRLGAAPHGSIGSRAERTLGKQRGSQTDGLHAKQSPSVQISLGFRSPAPCLPFGSFPPEEGSLSRERPVSLETAFVSLEQTAKYQAGRQALLSENPDAVKGSVGGPQLKLLGIRPKIKGQCALLP